jgi:hypothetical protein
VIQFIKDILAKEPARFVGYGSSLAVALALKLAEGVGVVLSADVLAAISLLTGFAISELIRRFVYAPATVQKVADAATDLPPGTPVDIGVPPSGGQG